MRQKVSLTIDGPLMSEVDGIVDNLYIRNRSQAVEHLLRQALGENKTAVILSGGPEEGIRVGHGYSITTSVGGKTVAERAVEKLRSSGFRRIVIVARHRVLTDVFSILGDGTAQGVKLDYVEEKESGGTAASLKLLRGRLKGPFLCVYGDIIFTKINLEALWADHRKAGGIATIMLTTSATPSEKGSVSMEGNKVLSFIQKPRQSEHYLVFSPIFAANEELLEQHGASLEKDVFPSLAKKGLLCGHLSSTKEYHIHTISDATKF